MRQPKMWQLRNPIYHLNDRRCHPRIGGRGRAVTTCWFPRRDETTRPVHIMGTLELMSSCALLNKFTHSSHRCVVYNVHIESDTANKRMVADIGVTDNGL